MKKKAIGVLGGTFDPVHTGHLVVAREVLDRLELSEVLFIPAGEPYFKSETKITPARQRLEMVRLATAGEPGFAGSDIEIKRSGLSYTVDTIGELKKESGQTDEIYFILGWDSLADLPRWHEPSKLISLCRLVAVPRAGYPAPELEKLEEAIQGLSKRIIMLDKPQIDIRASVIRQRVAEGLPVEHMVPKKVAEYIKKEGLYLS